MGANSYILSEWLVAELRGGTLTDHGDISNSRYIGGSRVIR